jgi:ABC-type transport system substrate-binding protein
MRKRLTGILTIAVLVASACSSSTATPTAAPATAGATTAAATPTPLVSGNFTYLIDGEPTTFAGVANDLPTSYVDLAIYNALYTADNKLAMQPDLAASLPVTTADGLTWTVKLRTDVKFHDGTAMTADDVVFSYSLMLSPNCSQNSDVCSSISDNVASVTATDASTVVFVLKQKFAPFLTTGLGAVYIMPKKAITDSMTRLTGVASSEAAAVADETKKVDAALAADACQTATPPSSCDASMYVAEIEPLLTAAKVALPDKNAYKDDKGAVDMNAYGTELVARLDDLNKTLTSSSIDQIAASLKIIDWAQAPIGTGPYKWVSYVAGQAIELARNDAFYANVVGPAKVFIPIIKDSATGSAALQKGDVNWQYDVTSDWTAKVLADQNLQAAQFPDFGYYYIGFNMRAGHMYADQNLRTAFTMCIDHDKTVEVATSGQGIPVYADEPPASWAYNTNVPKYKLDVAGAKTLIESSGWALGSDGVYAKAGTRLSSILYVRQGRPQRVKFAQLAADQLKACGIEIVVKESDFSTVLVAKVLTFPNVFDTYLGGWSTSIDPDTYSIFHSSKASTKDLPEGNNFVGWNNPQADELLVQGRQELDQAKRKAIYDQFELLINKEAPYYFLWADKRVSGLTKTVQGTIDLTSPLYYWNMPTWTIASK